MTESDNTNPERLTRKKVLINLLTDPGVKLGTLATIESAGHILITLADAVPGLGDVPSLLADAMLGIKVLMGHPDRRINPVIAIGLELLEPLSGGFLPTHAYEAWMIVHSNWPAMTMGMNRTRKILAGEEIGTYTPFHIVDEEERPTIAFHINPVEAGKEFKQEIERVRELFRRK